MERKKEVKTFLVGYGCSNCEVGEMEYKEMILPSTWGGCTTTENPKWKHKCDTCDNEEELKTKYPYTTYECY